MYRLIFVLLISASAALAQGAANSQGKGAAKPAAPATPAQSAQPAATKPADIPPDTPIITVENVCPDKSSKSPDCKTIVTKAQFEKLLAVFAGGRNVPLMQRRKLAMDYGNYVAYGAEAEKEGLDKDADTQELIKFARLQALAQVMRTSLSKKAQPTPEEMQKYYDSHKEDYKQLKLQRILLAEHPGNDKDEDAKNKEFAEELRKKAAANGDFKALQAEASEKAGQQNPPDTSETMIVRNISPSQEAVKSLKVGEVSQVIEDPNGYYIYKLESTDYLPYEQVKGEIENTLKSEHMKQETEKFMPANGPTLNVDYFGPTPGAGRPMPPRPDTK